MSGIEKIKAMKDLNIDYMKVVLYGNPGTGKTTAAATFPKVLFLSAEAGLLSIRDRDIDVWEIEKWEDLEEAFMFLKPGNHGYLTVVIDSETEVQKKLNEYLVRKYPTVQRAYDNLTSQSDWGASIDKLRKMSRAFRDLPMNVVFICLAQETMVGDEAVTRPALSGKTLPDELCGWVDSVIYCGTVKNEAGNTEYLGQLVPAAGRRAKMRVPMGTKVPEVINLTEGYTAIKSIMFPAAPVTKTATKKEGKENA